MKKTTNMKRMKKEAGDGVPFARKEAYEWEGTKYEADIQQGDVVKIMDEGNEEQGQFGVQFNLKIETRNGVKKLSVNQTSENTLIDAFGDESQQWVGKTVTVYTKKDIINNKKVIIAYLVPDGYILDEWGDVVKDEPDVPRDEAVAPNVRGKDYPEEDVSNDPNAVPF